MSVDAKTATAWESLVMAVVRDLIGELPDIIRNGDSVGGVSIPAYDDVPLPDLSGFDIGDDLPLCPLLYSATGNTLVSTRGARLGGLDSIALYGDEPLTFPAQDIELSMRVIFDAIAVKVNWETHTPCAEDENAPIDTVHNGTLTVRLLTVQCTVGVRLDPTASSAKSATVTLTDHNQTWASQPTFDPMSDVTFDSSIIAGQKMLLRAALNSDTLLKTLRDSARTIIEGPTLSYLLRMAVSDALASVS
jgi:hypothetical protein